MKNITLLKLVTVLFAICISVPVIGQDGQNSKLPGRKYVPSPQALNQNFNAQGNIDAPAGSISVAENATYNAYTPAQLVQNVLVTGCLEAYDVRFGYYKKDGSNWNWTDHSWSSTAGNRQLAYFNKGTSTFPLQEGLLLTTGKASSAMGPNNAGNFTDEMVALASDPDLSAITDKRIYDAAVLEFKFKPAGNTLEFTYVFTSEEYIEYCETEFNDAFGFFLNGPSISGPYYNNSVNLATIPGNIPVSINTIHPAGTNVNNVSFPAENDQYYVNNPSGSVTMQFDGGTVVLTATYTVVPCQEYNIRMAVGDASDQKWDAGVFLGARSFNSENIILTNYGNFIEGQNNVFEGCNNKLRVERTNPDLSAALTVPLLLSGTFTNGVDIQTTGGAPFPTSVTIPAGSSYVDIPYTSVDDGTGDNGETFIVKVLTSCPCSATTIYVTLNVNIYEKVVINSVSANNAQCNGQSNGSITVNASGGSGSYLYSINNGTNWQAVNNFTNLTPGSYTILVKDPGSCHPNLSTTATVGNPAPIVANAGSDVAICAGGNTQLNGTGGIQYSWSPATGLNFTNIANPIASPSATTTYTLTVTNSNGQCASTDQVVVTVNPLPIAPTSASVDRNNFCPSDAGNIVLSASGGSGTTLKWYSGSCGGSLVGTGNNLSIPSPEVTTTYYASWTNSCGNSTCASVQVTVVDNTPPVITCPAAITVACGASIAPAATGTATATDNCGTPTITYSDAGSVGTGCGGTITRTWVASDGINSTSCQQIITVSPAPIAAFATVSPITVSCGGAAPSSLSYNNGGSGSCLISGEVTSTLSALPGLCGGEVTETWTFTDACNRTITKTRIITVNPAPIAAFATVSPITVNCGGAAPS